MGKLVNFIKAVSVATVLTATTVSSYANVVILGTRVVYPADAKEISVKLSNPGDKPALVQAWIDKGETGTNTKAKTPFIITPPLFRLDPKKGQNLRIIYNKEPLATDRETLYYLNVLDIPPKPSAKDPNAPQNYLQFSIRSKLKFFFRPSGLTTAVADAPKSVVWQLGSENGKPVLTAQNDSPYHISFTKVSVNQSGKSYVVTNPQMVEPKSTMSFELPSAVSGNATVEFEHINDFGAKVSGQAQTK